MGKPWYEQMNKQIVITPINWEGLRPFVVVHYYKEEDRAVYDIRDNKYCIDGWEPATAEQVIELLYKENK